MTQRTQAPPPSVGLKAKPLCFLIQWLICTGGISLLATAQTQATALDPGPEALTSAPLAPSADFSLDLTPVAPAEPSVSPAAVEPIFAAPIAPTSEVPAAPEPAIAAPVVPESAASAPSGPTAAPETNGAYIDPQEYHLGATQTEAYRSPNEVILTERTTGCQLVLPEAQGIPGNLCATRTVLIPAEPATGSFSGEAYDPTTVAPRVTLSGAISSLPVPESAGNRRTGFGQYSFNRASSSAYKTANPLKWLIGDGKQMLFPLPMPVPITSAFGWRLHPISGVWRLHTGIDLGAPLGTPVLAAFAGQVTLADFLGGYGLSVFLEHNQGKQETRYAHLSEVFVQPGQWVKQGSVIGLVGSTGNSTGPHLHFEMLELTPEGRVAVDPGVALKTSLAQLVKALQTARVDDSAQLN